LRRLGGMARPSSALQRFLHDNSLSIVLLAAFALSALGQALTGWQVERAEAAAHGVAAPGLAAYVAGADFLSSLFESWESEFLQMAAYVVLTACLFQRGSPESRDPDRPEADDADFADRRGAPWPARGGGIVAALYARSLGIALALLFAVCFVLHLVTSSAAAASKAMRHGVPAPALAEHLGDAQFWFESFQNWQSEFLSTAVLVLLAIVLRQRGSPESKPVGAPHSQTGT